MNDIAWDFTIGYIANILKYFSTPSVSVTFYFRIDFDHNVTFYLSCVNKQIT